MRMVGTTFASIAAMVTAVSVSAQRQRPPADELIQAASSYVARFVDTLSNVVAEEHYVQEVPPQIVAVDGLQRRDVRADFLLVRASRGERWMQFRDIREVNGRQVNDRSDRLAQILSQRDESELQRGRRMADESARYNIAIPRTFNLPLYAIGFLQSREVTRFRYEVERADADVGPGVWIVSFRETARPTVILDAGGRNMPTSGRFWISSQTGQVWKTEWRVPFLTRYTGVITTVFESDKEFPVLVPRRMEERYFSAARPALNSRAEYGQFRRFIIATEEVIQPK